MNNKQGMVALVLTIASLLMLSGCSSDCSWAGKTEAFVYENTNGTWDAGEMPLEGVTFEVYGKNEHRSGISDATGKAVIAFFATCNEEVDYSVVATPPETYALEKVEPVQSSNEGITSYTFAFTKAK